MYKIIIASLFVLTAACGSKPPMEKISTSADPTSEINLTEQALSEARTQQVDVFAPTNFSKAEKSLKDAKESRSDRDKNEKILGYVAQSRAWLEQAKQRAQVSKTATSSLEQQRAMTVQAGAAQTHSKEFKKLEADMKDFTEDMEKGDLAKADKKSAALTAEYRDLELKAVKSTYLSAAEANIKTARDEGAKKSAPQSLATAEMQVSKAHSVIDANPRNLAAIQAASEIATRESANAVAVNRKVKGLQNTSEEQLVLKAQSQDKALATAVATTDVLAATTARTQARLMTLQEKQAQQAKVDSVRNNFAPSEAEVLQEGDKVLIRLKGLNFKSNQAVIEAKYYPLLKKVQETLATLDAKDIVIEGHTDAVGKADANLALSEKRATAVEQYLISNNAVTAENVEAKGMGFEKPITENKTPQGRAQNRRIDLVITTQ